MHFRTRLAATTTTALALAVAPLAAPVALADAAPSLDMAGDPTTPASTAPHGDTLERTWSYTGDLTAAHLIAVTPQGDVFVGGTDDKLRRYDLAGKLTGSFASPIDYFLEAMTAAPNGDIHVADQGSYVYDEPGAVWVLSRDGELKRGYLAPHSRNHIEGIAVAPDGSSYASDSWTDEVHRFSPTGAYLGSFGGTGVAPGQFDGPAGITIGTDGSVFVADRNNDRIQRFTASGKFLAAWGQAGDRPGELSVPQYLATTPPGNIIVGSDYFGPAQEFRPDGTHVSTFGGDDFWTATGVATDSRGAGYLTAKTGTYSHSILKFVPSSTTTASKVTQRYGKSAKLTVHVSPKPAGTVQVKVGKKTVNAPVTSGRARVTLPKKALKPGTHKLEVSYRGVDGQLAPSTTTARLTVTKAKAKVTAKAAKKKVRRDARARIKVTVKTAGLTPSGKVTVKIAGAKKRTVKLKKGRATVRIAIPRSAKPGKKKVTVTYRGSNLIAKAKLKKSLITVRR